MSHDTHPRAAGPSGPPDPCAAPRTAFAAETIVARPAGPVRAPVPTWAKVLIVLGVLGFGLIALGIVAAIAIPVFLNQREKAADVEVKSDLRSVASAEESYYTDFASYTADPSQLDVAQPASQIAVLAADSTGYCLGGRPADGRGNVWYYSSSAGLTRTSCV